jgi:pimeloyl-ACP methyl ester carboxylesterase
MPMEPKIVEIRSENSTNVRSVPAGLRAAQLGMRAAETVSPTLALGIAERLWFKPPQPPLSSNARAFLETATEKLKLRYRGQSLSAWAWGHGPLAVLMHGWGGRATQLRSFVPALRSVGFRVLMFDAPGHGESGSLSRFGKQSTLMAFTQALEAIAEHQGAPQALVAHSFGAAASGLALSRGLKIPRVAYLAPMNDPRPYLIGFAGMLDLSERLTEALQRRIEARVDEPMAEVRLATLLPKLAVEELLVVHDRDDAEIRLKDVQKSVAARPGTQLVVTDGLGHRRILANPSVVQRVSGFLAGRSALETGRVA